MPYITNKTTEEKVEIYYEDYGNGKPVILIHGWPLCGKAWENQVEVLVENGFRTITYDRRGFGNSSRPWNGYDYDGLTSDLNELIEQLNLEDVTLVGFSMGGGEVIRYLSTFGSKKIEKAALIASIIPLVEQKEDNPHGVPTEGLKGLLATIKKDRVGFLKDFHKGFYNYDKNKDRVSEAQLEYDFSIASNASRRATLKTAEAWAFTDFRPELEKMDIPFLIVHGDDDQTVPIKTSAKQASEMIENNTFEVINGAPHGLNITHKEELNKLLLKFL